MIFGNLNDLFSMPLCCNVPPNRWSLKGTKQSEENSLVNISNTSPDIYFPLKCFAYILLCLPALFCTCVFLLQLPLFPTYKAREGNFTFPVKELIFNFLLGHYCHPTHIGNKYYTVIPTKLSLNILRSDTASSYWLW